MNKAELVDRIAAHPRHVYPPKAELRKWRKDELEAHLDELVYPHDQPGWTGL